MDMIGNTPEINDHQRQYVTWMALSPEERDPPTEVGLARRLGVNRTTLDRWRKDPQLQLPERAASLARYQLVSR
jgi:transposase-like protein